MAVDRVSKYAYTEVYSSQTASNAAAFLQNLIKHIPYKIHRILTDNITFWGAQFSYNLLAENLKPKNKTHAFDKVCADHSIIHKTTQFMHPWSEGVKKTLRGSVFSTNGQVERMNRTIKDATIKRYHYDTQSQFRQHLQEFLDAYNFAKKLKALKFQTPWDFIVDKYENNATLFVYL